MVADAIRAAADIGYRHFDCASVYGNEAHVGRALRDIRATVPRDELWVTSKVWNDAHAPAAVAASCRQSLRDLQIDHLDLYLVHWPFPNHHPPGCDVDNRNPHAVPYRHERYLETWGAMERLVDEGLVRHLGTSNMTEAKLRPLLRDARVRPIANEMELHPHFQQPALFDFVRAEGMVPIGYCPIGSPARPERDRTPEDTVATDDPVLVEIARRRSIHPATLCVQWAAQRGQVPIPFSTSRDNLRANFEAVTAAEPLTEAEMAAIAGIDRDCRLIKGQVFLWEGARSWEDLWDLDGTLPA